MNNDKFLADMCHESRFLKSSLYSEFFFFFFLKCDTVLADLVMFLKSSLCNELFVVNITYSEVF